MEPDYLRLDPEERRNKFMAMLSALFGIASLCAGLIPACGFVVSIVGGICGFLGIRSENRRIAILGIVLSGLGLLITIVYTVLRYITKQ
jgi:Mn2+/Fe2+ NRAMP family transporter